MFSTNFECSAQLVAECIDIQIALFIMLILLYRLIYLMTIVQFSLLSVLNGIQCLQPKYWESVLYG